MGGDINDLEVQKLLDISPTFHMLNTKLTYGQANIDVIISDIAHLCHESVILRSVPTYIPADQPWG